MIEGRVVPEGVDLNYVVMDPEELFWRMAKYQEFDASEFSLGAYVIMLSRGDRSLVGIPVFPSRFFRHSCIYINVKSGIQKPEDLRETGRGSGLYHDGKCVDPRFPRTRLWRKTYGHEMVYGGPE